MSRPSISDDDDAVVGSAGVLDVQGLSSIAMELDKRIAVAARRSSQEALREDWTWLWRWGRRRKGRRRRRGRGFRVERAAGKEGREAHRMMTLSIQCRALPSRSS